MSTLQGKSARTFELTVPVQQRYIMRVLDLSSDALRPAAPVDARM